ncbi:46d25246-56c0-4962-9e5d-110cf59fbf7b [Sclerotinia trifoliorum]|uniref:46d25246-56c0-4962-9e5d-110cf59fbf7b n=1 Tax=Sclerotinia trifoliorum TaxID=28548 RepID=A0A8H2W404_9HELO|nr:46d25246-56c0-4962-9e5d-110cf59fbf7b [Sclerotinia trifoliorum]
MEFAINYQSKGQWHFADLVSGSHLASKPTDVFDLSQEGGWLLVNEKQRVHAMASSGMRIDLKRRNWCFSSRQKLSFKYVAPTKPAELSGTYTWKYDKKWKKYMLKKRRHSWVFTTLALDTDFPATLPAKMQIFDRADIFEPGHALISMNNELASKELDRFIHLSTLSILLEEERKMSICSRGDERDDKADPAAQTTGVMKCGCLCHCFPAKCTLIKFEKKLNDMFNVTVREVESEKEELPA